MNVFTFCFVASLLATSVQVIGNDDPVRPMLEKAKAEYEQNLTEYRKLANEYLDKGEEVARKQGSKKLVDRIKAARETFENTGDLPTTAPATLRARPATALTTLTTVYERAVESYTRVKQDDLAAAAEKELAAITAKAGIPWIAGVWRQGPKENGIHVIITLHGDEFVATHTYQHKKYGKISWRITGTVSKEGEISGKLVYTKAPRSFPNQTVTGKFFQAEGLITGHGAYNGGGWDFEWKRIDN